MQIDAVESISLEQLGFCTKDHVLIKNDSMANLLRLLSYDATKSQWVFRVTAITRFLTLGPLKSKNDFLASRVLRNRLGEGIRTKARSGPTRQRGQLRLRNSQNALTALQLASTRHDRARFQDALRVHPSAPHPANSGPRDQPFCSA